MNVSFKGIGENLITFQAGTTLNTGYPVKITADGTVGDCSANDVPCGICVDKRGSLCSVLVSGYYNMSYTPANTDTDFTHGFCSLVADGSGKVKYATTGLKVLVTDIDTDNNKIGFII